jgi:hypothetical protein
MPDPKLRTPSAPPRQLCMAFVAVQLRGMSPAERRTAVAMLATLLTEAAGSDRKGRDDDGR